jgi:hypothetical protein
MARLLIHVEGQTEEGLVTEILREHLTAKGFDRVDATLGGNPRLRHRGGIRPWSSFKADIMNHLKEDQGCFATTMVDYYGMPHSWPGRAQAAGMASAEEKARFVEDAVSGDLLQEMGDRFDPSRFVPFVVVHEFEGLLFSDCAAFSSGIGRPELRAEFQGIRDGFATPEEIDDSPETAPSKRVGALVHGYQKPFLGILAVLEIGLARIQDECPHFGDWLRRLEGLVH